MFCLSGHDLEPEKKKEWVRAGLPVLWRNPEAHLRWLWHVPGSGVLFWHVYQDFLERLPPWLLPSRAVRALMRFPVVFWRSRPPEMRVSEQDVSFLRWTLEAIAGSYPKIRVFDETLTSFLAALSEGLEPASLLRLLGGHFDRDRQGREVWDLPGHLPLYWFPFFLHLLERQRAVVWAGIEGRTLSVRGGAVPYYLTAWSDRLVLTYYRRVLTGEHPTPTAVEIWSTRQWMRRHWPRGGRRGEIARFLAAPSAPSDASIPYRLPETLGPEPSVPSWMRRLNPEMAGRLRGDERRAAGVYLLYRRLLAREPREIRDIDRMGRFLLGEGWWPVGLDLLRYAYDL